MTSVRLKALLLAVIVVVLSVGLYDFMTNFETNGCEMTYMYQQPNFKKINLNATVTAQFPRYSLHLYGEGTSPPEATGIPVLFIPGNAGSHRQVRSMSSVALKMAETKKTDFHFSYFAIDFNEEFSALSGAILQKHTEFSHECLKQIFSLYSKRPNPPKTVVLEGHSMGGMVARALFTLDDFDHSWVHTIITKAAPHQAPVMTLDATMAEQYSKINNYWRRHSNDTLKHVTVFSSGGGFRDRLVRSGLTSLDGIVRPDLGLSTMTMAMPQGWVSVDHQCHVWCKQIVMATIRALFDAVDRNTKQLAVSTVYRMKVFLHHFDTNAGSHHYKPAVDTVTLKPAVKLHPLTTSPTQFVGKVTQTRHFLLDVKSNWGKSLVVVTNIKTERWLAGCASSDVNCSAPVNLAANAFIVPPLYSNKKVLHLSSQEISRYHSLIAVVPKPHIKDYSTQLTTEFFSATDRNIRYAVTGFVMFFRGLTKGLNHEDVVIPLTAPQAVFYNISLDGLDIPLQAYTALLTVVQCTAGTQTGSLMKLHVPWSREHTYRTLGKEDNATLSLKLQSGRPNASAPNAQLHLYLDPTCSYTLTIRIAWNELLGQFFRFYVILLPAYLAVQVLLVLSWQLKKYADNGTAPSFIESQSRWAQPWRITGAAFLIKLTFSFPADANIAKTLGLPPDDSDLMQALNIWYPAVPAVLCVMAYATMSLFQVVLHRLLVLISYVVMIIGRLGPSSAESEHDPDHSSLTQVARLIRFVAIILSVGLNEMSGVCLIFILQLFNVISHYISMKRSDKSKRPIARSKYHVNVTILQLLMLMLALNFSSLFMWLKQLTSTFQLTWDADTFWSMDESPMGHTFWSPGLFVCLCVAFFINTDFPNTTCQMYSDAGNLIFVSSMVVILYGTLSVYRISYFITSALLIVAVPAAIEHYLPQ